MNGILALAARLWDLRDGRMWLFRALCLWVILAGAAGVKACLWPGKHSVYLCFPRAAQHWWADMNLYGRYDGFDLYRYSPTFAVAATPFGLMSDSFGGLVWVIGSVAILVWSFRTLIRELLPGDWSARREAAFLSLALVGSIGGIWSSQSNAIILAMVIFGLVAIRQRRWWRAVWLLAAPVFIKLWPLAVFLLLLVRWWRPLLGRFMVSCAALAAVPFATRPWHIVCRQYHDWYLALVGPLQGRWGGFRDAWTIWEEFFPPVVRHGYLLLQLATALAVFGWCCWQSRRTRNDCALLTAILAIWSAWQLLLGPGTERLTYGLVAPAQAWAVLITFQQRRLRVLSLAAWAVTALLSMGDIERSLGRLLPHAPAVLPLGIVLFLGWLAAYHATGPAPGEPAGARRQGELESPARRKSASACN